VAQSPLAGGEGDDGRATLSTGYGEAVKDIPAIDGGVFIRTPAYAAARIRLRMNKAKLTRVRDLIVPG